MSSNLTKAFAEFVGGRGFLIANAGEISQQLGEDYKLARQIFRNKRVLLPFLTKLAVVAEGQTPVNMSVNMPRQMCRGHSVVAAVAVVVVRGLGLRRVGLVGGGCCYGLTPTASLFVLPLPLRGGIAAWDRTPGDSYLMARLKR